MSITDAQNLLTGSGAPTPVQSASPLPQYQLPATPVVAGCPPCVISSGIPLQLQPMGVGSAWPILPWASPPGRRPGGNKKGEPWLVPALSSNLVFAAVKLNPDFAVRIRVPGGKARPVTGRDVDGGCGAASAAVFPLKI